MELPVVDAATTVIMDKYDEIIIQINQELSNPNEDVLLVSTFQVRYNDTTIGTAPI